MYWSKSHRDYRSGTILLLASISYIHNVLYSASIPILLSIKKENLVLVYVTIRAVILRSTWNSWVLAYYRRRFIEYRNMCNGYCGLRHNGNGLIVTIIIDHIVIYCYIE